MRKHDVTAIRDDGTDTVLTGRVLEMTPAEFATWYLGLRDRDVVKPVWDGTRVRGMFRYRITGDEDLVLVSPALEREAWTKLRRQRLRLTAAGL